VTSPSTPSLGLPSIPPENRISPSGYLEVLQGGTSHVLLDVRSQIQFNMISLPLGKYSPNASAVKYLNTPFAALSSSPQSGEEVVASAASVTAGSCSVVALFPYPHSPGEGSVPIYVLCRRGNDSVRATALLREAFPEIKVFNIDGGLSSWATEVDSTFPLY
jgi:rhodanese-related sulfurtransferase